MARKIMDRTGRKFGLLTVLSYSHTENHHTFWHCRCDCGKDATVSSTRFVRGKRPSCGCAYKYHGLAKHPLYLTWYGMIARCTDPSVEAFRLYGGRGITVCDRWRNSLQAFIDDMGERPKGHTIDRIENNGNYEPSNCRWATPMQQGNNTRANRLLTYQGKTQTASQWRRELGFGKATFAWRMRQDWPVEMQLAPVGTYEAGRKKSKKNDALQGGC